MVSIMERSDENLLPAVYKEVSETFNAGPTDLGYLTFIRNFVQALSSPLAGVLALQYDRPAVLAMGTACWALSTAAVGVSQKFLQVAFWRALNGLGLAIVIPALQSFIADSYKDDMRGAGFGLLNLVGSVGGIGGSALATIMAGQVYWGMPGWRFAFIMMAVLSLMIGLLVFFFVVDPRRTLVSDDADDYSERVAFIGSAIPVSVWGDSWSAMKAVMKVRTFRIIVFQGVIGSLPWTSMVFFTMWFELIGFDNNSSAALNSLFFSRRRCRFVARRTDSRQDIAVLPRYRPYHVCSVQCFHGHSLLLNPPPCHPTVCRLLVRLCHHSLLHGPHNQLVCYLCQQPDIR